MPVAVHPTEASAAGKPWHESCGAARSLAGDGLSLLLATHDGALARHADRVVVLHEGRVQASGAPGELLGPPPWRPAWRGGLMPAVPVPALARMYSASLR